ncbi:zinc-binding dehydrogenase [Garicola koreensis]|uniref:S-(Hydroxymethyl)glutathione dehydrogenase/alcohol dehydrogenase n=1 Tax=Garicola koreensis TaxID=1262554 RepID=A0A7W5TX79_9MICC|nr:zinc-binding dehydrogenase [Garicola koreensis]MBB3668359.1 S-(hydroxymethyl)glutathione dehydrogenase/alcohol dehydrogenase [Garicola koreensis]
MPTASAFVLEKAHEPLRADQITVDPPQADEVLIDVAACGVCHTDLHVIKDEVAFPKPAVLGHEVSGVVREVGAAVTHVQAGDRVACSFIMPCGACRHCAEGLEDLCENFFNHNRVRGQLYDGGTRLSRGGEDLAMYSMAGHATCCVVPSRAVFALPDSVPLADAAVLGCSLFTGHGAVHSVAQVQPGENVAVIAAGGVGLSIIHLARAAGAQRVIAVDIDDEKLDLAYGLGATDVINSAAEEPAVAVRQLLGRGVDVAFEALGSVATVKLAVDMLDDGGRAVLCGIAPAGQTLDVDITKLVRRKLKILGSFGASAATAMPEVIQLAAEGKIDLDTLITHRFAFDQTAEAYQLLNERKILGRGLIETNPALV